MKQLSDDDINKMLAHAKLTVPAPDGTVAFERILKKIAEGENASHIPFKQLRNTSIVMLLILAVNILIVSNGGNKNDNGASREELTPYLQPYNLNLY